MEEEEGTQGGEEMQKVRQDENQKKGILEERKERKTMDGYAKSKTA